MFYKILADIVLFIHFSWIIFLISGFILTLAAFYRKRLFNKCFFRLLHLAGIIYASILYLMGKYCPLTILENTLRGRYSPDLTYRGAFIAQYMERFIYPDINLRVIYVPLYLLILFVIVVFFIRPPEQIKDMFRKTGEKK